MGKYLWCKLESKPASRVSFSHSGSQQSQEVLDESYGKPRSDQQDPSDQEKQGIAVLERQISQRFHEEEKHESQIPLTKLRDHNVSEPDVRLRNTEVDTPRYGKEKPQPRIAALEKQAVQSKNNPDKAQESKDERRWEIKSVEQKYKNEPIEAENTQSERKMKALGGTILKRMTGLAPYGNTASSHNPSIPSVMSEQCFLDGGINGHENIRHILDPVYHFQRLDNLEIRVARELEFLTGDVPQLWSIEILKSKWTRDMQSSKTDFDRICCAYRSLRDIGFCDDLSILVQDRGRDNVAITVIIEFSLMGTFVDALEGVLSIWDAITDGDDKWKHFCFIVELLLSRAYQRPPISANGLTTKGTVNDLAELYIIFSYGMFSYSGSHVSEFGMSIFGLKPDSFHIASDFFLGRRTLTCLGDFIGGPAWIFGPNRGPPCAISITATAFNDLWGPLWKIPVPGRSNMCQGYRTERGIIRAVTVKTTVYINTPVETLCHLDSVPGLSVDTIMEQDHPPKVFAVGETMLIGMISSPETYDFTENTKCCNNMKNVQMCKATDLKFPGTCSSVRMSKGAEVTASLGYYGACSDQRSEFYWHRS
ncbi:hypothetical protein AOQ84DRAFT_441458 [Glonium stellatum]|uniref:Uncharacterized protein n=1 Tax=Glonium stellatum TaxID=574774 RepID=A0A8E2EVN0_9PEZI|nr:hypothetical protein AOQ84DRAFT_441458 [Glonium stellatum]